MTAQIIEQKIHKILQENLMDSKVDRIEKHMELFSLGLNSLNAVSIVLGLEDAFGFEFDLDEISFDRFRSVSDIFDLVSKKLQS